MNPLNPCIYILRFKESGKFYVGSTTDLERRLNQHKQGHTRSTKRLGEFKLVFWQATQDLKSARSAEKQIKSWKRRDFIERIIQDGRIAFLDSADERA
ncbi:MAG TPA: GIY-YIG nuclease family protein [Candidatus Saccharimonadales bacterium]|nr:GIY-YIG nuclease family protein [Candidatus Saccharimonadales bacterium]